MAGGESSSFRTRRRFIQSNGELAWGGGDGESWVEAIESSDGITVTADGVIAASEIPESGISRYTFEETVDSTLVDVWNGYNGVINGPSYDSDSVEGSRSLRFGDGDYVNLGQYSAHEFAAGESFTVTWWRKSSDTGNAAYIANSYSQDASGQQQPWYLARPKNQAEFYLRDTNGDNFHAQGPNIADNEWHMQTCVYDAEAAEIRLYIDGVLEATVGGVTEEPYGNNGGDFILGSHSVYYLFGRMDDLRLYGKALVETEVVNLRDTGSITR